MPPSYLVILCLQVYETKGTLYLVTGSNDKNVNVYSVGVSVLIVPSLVTMVTNCYVIAEMETGGSVQFG